jgi:hypothetical protein
MMTPEEVASNRRIAQAMMQQGQSTAPVEHWLQAVARGAQGVVGAWQNDSADRAEREGRATGDKAIADALAGKGDVKGMLGNPWSADTGRKLAVSQINQRMQDASPSSQMALKLKQQQLQAAQWELENNREMSPLKRQLIQAQINAANAKDDTFKTNIVPEGGTLVQTHPRTGESRVVASGGPKPMQEWQTKDAMWAERLGRSNQTIDTVAGVDSGGKPKGDAYDPTRWQNRYFPDDASWKNLGLANIVNSKQWQQYQQAAREGIAAVLRKDTGAAVTQQEWDLYFPMLYPQPGDAADVVKQKNATRAQMARALRASSGGAYDRIFPQDQQPQQGGGDSGGWSVKRID